MSYDLFVWWSAAAIGAHEARLQLEQWIQRDEIASESSVDARLTSFASAVSARWPSVLGAAEPDMDDLGFELEFAQTGGYAFIGIPWPHVDAVSDSIRTIAQDHDLLVYDPQQSLVTLPPRLGGTSAGAKPDVELPLSGISNALEGSFIDTGDPETATQDFIADWIKVGNRVESPLGFEVEASDLGTLWADPTMLPKRLQTPARKAEALAALRSKRTADRLTAVTQLAGWEPDPEVAVALRELVTSADPLERVCAVSGLARQGAIEAIDDVLGVVRQDIFSGDAAGLLSSERAALELAAKAGDHELQRARNQIDKWTAEIGQRARSSRPQR